VELFDPLLQTAHVKIAAGQLPEEAGSIKVDLFRRLRLRKIAVLLAGESDKPRGA